MVLAYANVMAQDSTIVEIFNAKSIQHGYVYQEDVDMEDNGRVISKTLELPSFDSSVEILAYLEITSLGDPWDRAGTVTLSNDNGADIELLKFMTAYNVPTAHVEDVSRLAPLLSGEVTIKAFIDTWQLPGFEITFKLVYKQKSDAINADWIAGAFFSPGVKRTDVSNNLTTVDVRIPSGISNVNLAYFTSGHCTDGRGADEFVPKYNVIYIDGEEVHRYQPWRNDCANFPSYGSYTLSRSGWCPGDIVHPLMLDVTDYLQPGDHQIRYVVEDARGVDESGNYGYWRISSYLAGWLSNTPPEATKISLSQPLSKVVSIGEELTLRLSVEDENNNLVVTAPQQIRVISENNNILLSENNIDFTNEITLEVKNGSALVWVKGDGIGEGIIKASDINGNLSDSDPVEITLISNYALNSFVTAEDFCSDSEAPNFAVDGSLTTMWCSDQNPPTWLKISCDEMKEINCFRIYHAGAAGNPPHMNTADYSIEVYDHQTSQWDVVVELFDNYDTAEGNITYHYLDEAVYTDSIRLNIITPGYGDDITRIYEFQIFNIEQDIFNQITSVEKDSYILLGSFELYQNYPNPFNGSTNIRFSLQEHSGVDVTVYNVLGEVVNNLFSGNVPRGDHIIKWNGKNMTGNNVAGGIYLYQISVRSSMGEVYSLTKKMIFLP